MHPSYTKIHAKFSKCDNVTRKIQIFMSLQVGFWCEIFHKYEKNMDMEYSIAIPFKKRKINRFFLKI